jgi:lactoylglutathione lyase
MKFLWTTFYVKNMEESIAFYSDFLGLKVQKRFPAGPGLEIAFMGNGVAEETLVELIADKNKSAFNYGDFISVGFAVDSVEAMLNTVKGKNIPVYSGPVETPAFKFFCIKDPSGLSVQLFQQKK